MTDIDLTPEAVAKLDAKLSSQIGDDVSVIFDHEYLFKQSREMIAALSARMAEAEADAEKARRFTRIARDECAEWASRAIASRASLATAKYDALQEALSAIAAIRRPKSEDHMRGHEDAYHAVKALIPEEQNNDR